MDSNGFQDGDGSKKHVGLSRLGSLVDSTKKTHLWFAWSNVVGRLGRFNQRLVLQRNFSWTSESGKKTKIPGVHDISWVRLSIPKNRT
jgi:hypothetical protein